MSVPLDTAAAARAAIALGASGPRRLVELRLVDLPNAPRAPQKRQGYRPADWQQVMRLDRGHAASHTRLAGVALLGAAEAIGSKEPIAPAGIIGRNDTGCVAARAVDVQLQAVPGDVAYLLEWKRAEHGPKRNAAVYQESVCQQ